MRTRGADRKGRGGSVSVIDFRSILPMTATRVLIHTKPIPGLTVITKALMNSIKREKGDL